MIKIGSNPMPSLTPDYHLRLKHINNTNELLVEMFHNTLQGPYIEGKMALSHFKEGNVVPNGEVSCAQINPQIEPFMLTFKIRNIWKNTFQSLEQFKCDLGKEFTITSVTTVSQ